MIQRKPGIFGTVWDPSLCKGIRIDRFQTAAGKPHRRQGVISPAGTFIRRISIQKEVRLDRIVLPKHIRKELAGIFRDQPERQWRRLSRQRLLLRMIGPVNASPRSRRSVSPSSGISGS